MFYNMDFNRCEARGEKVVVHELELAIKRDWYGL